MTPKRIRSQEQNAVDAPERESKGEAVEATMGWWEEREEREGGREERRGEEERGGRVEGWRRLADLWVVSRGTDA